MPEPDSDPEFKEAVSGFEELRQKLAAAGDKPVLEEEGPKIASQVFIHTQGRPCGMKKVTGDAEARAGEMVNCPLCVDVAFGRRPAMSVAQQEANPHAEIERTLRAIAADRLPLLDELAAYYGSLPKIRDMIGGALTAEYALAHVIEMMVPLGDYKASRTFGLGPQR